MVSRKKTLEERRTLDTMRYIRDEVLNSAVIDSFVDKNDLTKGLKHKEMEYLFDVLDRYNEHLKSVIKEIVGAAEYGVASDDVLRNFPEDFDYKGFTATIVEQVREIVQSYNIKRD